MGLAVDLPDVNLWVALSSGEHVHNERATVYWKTEASPTIAFCSATTMGMLRVLTNRHTLQGEPLSVKAAWLTYTQWRADHAVTYIREPRSSEDILGRFALGGVFDREIWSDAYLAAFAIATGVRMVTFDSDFQKFEGLDLLLLA